MSRVFRYQDPNRKYLAIVPTESRPFATKGPQQARREDACEGARSGVWATSEWRSLIPRDEHRGAELRPRARLRDARDVGENRGK